MRALLILAVALASCAPANRPYDSYAFQVECERMVTESLKAPSTAKFEASTVAKQGQIGLTVDGYLWDGWVDAENSFGALVRTRFSCEYDREADNVLVTIH